MGVPEGFSVDRYLDARYDYTRYNCGHFVRDVWEDLTGEDISGMVCAFLGRDARGYVKYVREHRIIIDKENSPCLVLMNRQGMVPHAGVYIDENLLHLTTTGAAFQSLDLFKPYYKLTFYK